MNEWGIVTALVTLGSLIGLVAKPILTLTNSITELTTVVRDLKEDYVNLERKTTEGRTKFWKELDAQKDKIAEHDTRISVLENKAKEGAN